MIRALAHPVRARVLARGRERETHARVVVLARASDANDDDEALEREFERIRAKTEKAKKIPLSPRERAALADEWSLECRNIGLSHLERCFRARADATLGGADGPPIDQICKDDDADKANEAEIKAILLSAA